MVVTNLYSHTSPEMAFINKFAALAITSNKDNVLAKTYKTSAHSVSTDSTPGSPMPSLVTIEDEGKEGKTWAQVASAGVKTKNVVFKTKADDWKNKSPSIEEWIYQTPTKKSANTILETPTKPLKIRRLNTKTKFI